MVMKSKYFLSLSILFLLHIDVHGQVGTPVYKQLRQRFYDITYHEEWGNLCYLLHSDHYKYKGLADRKGNVVLAPSKYDYIYFDEGDKYTEAHFEIHRGEKVGYMDTLGNILLEAKYDEEYDILYYRDLHCFFLEGDTKTILLSSSGKKIIEKNNDDIGDIEEGLIAIREKKLWGYMDVANRKIIIPFQYTSARDFNNGVAKVSKGKESFIITNPLKSGGQSNVVSSMTIEVKPQSDIDINIYETRNKQENSFVIIIANQNYSDFFISNAIADGKVFREYCQKTIGIPQSNIIYYEDATLNNIHEAISRIVDIADAYEGDARIIFYYSGCGVTEQHGTPYLVPSDGTLNLLPKSGVSVEFLLHKLSSLNAESCIFFFDVGFDNKNREDSILYNGQFYTTKIRNNCLQGNSAAFFASSNGENAYLYKEKGHGLFTYFLCKKIQQTKGNFTLRELQDYLNINIPKIADQMQKKQYPNIIFSNNNIEKTRL